MKKFSLLKSACLFSLTLAVPSAFAEIVCTNNGANGSACRINLSLSSTEESPQTFYCQADPGEGDKEGKIFLVNNAQMVTGFTDSGTLEFTDRLGLNKYYFQSYPDTDPAFAHESGWVEVTAGVYNLSCHYGTGSGRELMPGPYGKPNVAPAIAFTQH
ncbi:MAG: hypothetical protein K0S08_968 [Gammaproteobacteria bacterium]|jgi:hypothetical protein|nr:hypothetical protein [Gammaproteobacteria bacterium]